MGGGVGLCNSISLDMETAKSVGYCDPAVVGDDLNLLLRLLLASQLRTEVRVAPFPVVVDTVVGQDFTSELGELLIQEDRWITSAITQFDAFCAGLVFFSR